MNDSKNSFTDDNSYNASDIHLETGTGAGLGPNGGVGGIGGVGREQVYNVPQTMEFPSSVGYISKTPRTLQAQVPVTTRNTTVQQSNSHYNNNNNNKHVFSNISLKQPKGMDKAQWYLINGINPNMRNTYNNTYNNNTRITGRNGFK